MYNVLLRLNLSANVSRLSGTGLKENEQFTVNNGMNNVTNATIKQFNGFNNRFLAASPNVLDRI